MPIRRLNYTARQPIARSDIDIVLQDSASQSARFDVSLDLTSYNFPPDARVFIEAYRQTTLMRFALGTVSTPEVPDDRRLTEFPCAAEVLFRVRVTATSGRPGVLVGEADRIRPREPQSAPDRRVPLLPAVSDDLGEEVWRIDFEGGTTLVVNRGLPDWKQTVSSDNFRALVYPAALRRILERIVIIEKYTETEDMEDWRSLWLQFASKIPGSRGIPVSRDDHDEWIENAVAAFARHFRLHARFLISFEQQ